jgi:pimeloyl-ACP methyl ester carboxylesterase
MSGPANGEPLVLLHGMNASSTMWYPNVKAFSEKHRVYAIDFLLEPGKSLCGTDMNSTDEIIKWYYEIFDQLKLSKFSIVGASRGGWLAINIALHSQNRISKIALLSPAQAFTWIKPMPKIISNITYSISPKRRRLRSVLETMTFDVDKLNQVYINQYFIATEKAVMNKCILQMTPFSNAQLRSLRIPVLVLIGDNDIINNHTSLAMAEKEIANVQTGTIKNAGHFLSFDQPEIVNSRVLAFLDQDNLNTKRLK